MSAPVLLFSTRNADGSAGQSDLALAPGMMIVTDAPGNPTLSPVPVVPAQRVNDVTFSAADMVGTARNVTFSSAMPSADYVLDLDYNGFAGMLRVTNKTAAGFTLTVVNALVGTVSYHAMQKT